MNRDLAPWLRRALIALGVVTAVVVATGLYLTFRYRPASYVRGRHVITRPALVGVAQVLHAAGAYLFLVLTLTVLGLALAIASRRGQTVAAIAASGLGLVFVSIAFVLTGRQLPWNGFVWVASGFERSFDGIIGFPPAVRSVLVGGGDTSPPRYETFAWIHIAGLPVFAVFAAWWMLGALNSSRKAAAERVAREAAAAPRRDVPARPVSVAEQFFGTDDPETVRLQVDGFLARHLRSGISALDFTRVGTGIVLGVRLADGRPAVVKLFPPGTNAAYLRALQDVQMHLAVEGFPAPQPLLDPQPFGVGFATVETRLPEPPPVDPEDRAVRRALAEGLATFVRLAAPLARRVALGGRGPLGPPAPGSVFPAPPGSAFDFPATAEGAEWIEEIGARARTLLDAAPLTMPVVGHFDWRVESAPVDAGRVAAVFDWDSVGSAPEAVVIGSAAHQFTLDWRSATPHVPTLEDVREFVADYEAARGTPLSVADRVMARTAYVFGTAYGARCEHALAVTGQAAPAGFREALGAHGAALLA